MRKLASIGVALVVLLCSACTCTAERKAVDRLGEQQEKLWTKYAFYVASDPRLDEAAKNDELKLLDSLRSLLASLRESLGD